LTLNHLLCPSAFAVGLQGARFVRESEGRLELRSDGGLHRRHNGVVRPDAETAGESLRHHGQIRRPRVADGMLHRRTPVYSINLNQSIKIYFPSNRNITVYYCVYTLARKRLPEKHTLIKLAAQTNKRTQHEYRQEGGRDRGNKQ